MKVAFVVCGALAREVMDITRRHGWDASFYGVDAQAHMRPERIAPLVEARLRELIPRFDRVVVIYGDCGTGGALDAVLRRYNVPRIAGPHCYEMYGGASFDAMMEEEPGTFFLTDFLLRGFTGMVWKGLGLDRFPQLKDAYFANYRRLVYLAQRSDDALMERAHAVAQQLGLPLEVRHTGYGALETRLVALMNEIAGEQYRPVMEQRLASSADHEDGKP
jgi:hypothetical protein